MTNTETRAITIHVSDRVYAGLTDHGRKAGYTPNFYAKLLFEAGYAARCGKGEDDPLLAACVAKSVSRQTLPSRPIAPAIAAPASRPVAASDPATGPGGVVPAITAPLPASAPPASPPAIAAAKPLAKAPSKLPAKAKESSAAKWGPANYVTFARLVCREEGASRQEVMAAVYPAYRDMHSLFVLVSNVRKRLEAEGVRLEVVDIWGWRTSPRAAAEALLGRLG
jgi:hypothetical protein